MNNVYQNLEIIQTMLKSDITKKVDKTRGGKDLSFIWQEIRELQRQVEAKERQVEEKLARIWQTRNMGLCDGAVDAGKPASLKDDTSPSDGPSALTIRCTRAQVGDNLTCQTTGNSFGYVVALSSNGNQVAVGRPRHNNGIHEKAGIVKIFDWSESGWIQVGQELVGQATDEGFGFAVALSSSGNRVAIGGPCHNNGIHQKAGIVKIFDWSKREGSWMQVGDNMIGQACEDDFLAIRLHCHRMEIG